jgi:hypothetical protein
VTLAPVPIHHQIQRFQAWIAIKTSCQQLIQARESFLKLRRIASGLVKVERCVVLLRFIHDMEDSKSSWQKSGRASQPFWLGVRA